MTQPDDLLLLTFAGVAAIASPLGGIAGLMTKTSTLFLSIVVGLAAGVLLATFAFEMLPEAYDSAGMIGSMAGFVAGFLLVYGLDLYINRGYIAGEEAEERHSISRLRGMHRRRTSDVTLLAAGTSAEELIEGVSIGVGLATDPRLGLMIGIAIVIDNFVEGLSIAKLISAESQPRARRNILAWTGLIGLSLFSSTLIGWYVLRDLPTGALGTLIAAGAGGMFYLTVTDLLPKSEKTNFQQSAALATGTGFLLVFLLSRLDIQI